MQFYSRGLWNEIYDILVTHGVATEYWRNDFRIYTNDTTATNFGEYRLNGSLGFGGKLWWDNMKNDSIPYVNCYQEDETPKRLKTIKLVNEKIKELVERTPNV